MGAFLTTTAASARKAAALGRLGSDKGAAAPCLLLCSSPAQKGPSGRLAAPSPAPPQVAGARVAATALPLHSTGKGMAVATPPRPAASRARLSSPVHAEVLPGAQPQAAAVLSPERTPPV